MPNNALCCLVCVRFDQVSMQQSGLSGTSTSKKKATVRCMNCQDTMRMDASLTEKYPEWRALSTSRSLRGNQVSSALSNAPDGSMGKSLAIEGSLADMAGMQGNLFDIICDSETPIDRPICQDCTDRLLDCMDQQLKGLEEECADYRRLDEKLKAQHKALDLNALRMDHAELQGETSRLRSELARLEAEEEEIERELEAERVEATSAKREEERLWRVYRDHSRRLQELEQDEESVLNQLGYVVSHLDKLSKTNIFNLTFHIWHQGQFGTINGFRLGRLPDEEVDWNEINAAWGQTCLLLSCLAKKQNLSFKRYKLVPFGNYSYVRVIEAEGSASGASGSSKERDLPLYCSGGYKILGNSKFDAGMVAYLECLEELKENLEGSAGFCLPYSMSKDKILDNGKEYSVRLQFNSLERWTKAMKCLLMNLKWALAWMASLQ